MNEKRQQVIGWQLEREAGEDTDHRCVCDAIIPKHRSLCISCETADERQWGAA